MTQWYYSDYERNRHGPVEDTDMAGLHDGGQLAPDTLVWREGMAEWRPWRSVMHEVVAPTAPAPAPAVSATGSDGSARGGYDPYAVAEPSSPYAPPRAPVQHAAGVHLDGRVVYAGFWKRVAAYFIDAVIVGIFGAMVGGAAGAAVGGVGDLATGRALAVQLVMQVFSLGLGACYYGFFYASANQATPGKMAVGIKVVRANGEGCSFWRGFVRYFATLLSGLLLCIGYLMVAFTERKQALHDMICDTVVVDRWAFTVHPDQQREELGTVTWVVLALLGLLMAGLALAFIGLIATLANR